MMDRINIKDLKVYAYHGVFPEETAIGQDFLISAALFLDLRSAGNTDDLAKTIDYSEICHVIKAFVEGTTFKLIETVAERLAKKLLTGYPIVRKVWIEVKKPSAPIGIPLDTVSVEIERGWHTAYISMGSNIGDRESSLRFAVGGIEKAYGCRAVRASEFINTAPYGVVEQDEFLNGCLEVETLLTPHELLGLLHDIENNAGRIRKERWGPRTLDLDIIFYDDLVISDCDLRIPHADMHNRRFVLEPLKEISPNKLHPVLMKTVAELLDELNA